MKKIYQIILLSSLLCLGALMGGCGDSFTDYEKTEMLKEKYGEDIKIKGLTYNEYVIQTTENDILYIKVTYHWPTPFHDAKNLRVSQETTLFELNKD